MASYNNLPIDSAIVISNIENQKLPKDTEEAKWCLQFMFTQETWYTKQDQGLQLYALSILQSYPDLAYATFSGCYDQMDLPLLIILRAMPINANLQAVQAIYEMYPEAVEAKTYKYTSDLAIHVACQFEAGFDVIEFLAKEYPDALYEGNDELSRPIHELLSYCGSNEHLLDTVQCLVELAPETTWMKDKNRRIPLETAMFMDKGIDVIEYLISKLPENFAEFHVDSSWKQFTFGENAAQSVRSLLNKLEELHCRPPDWTSTGFSLLLSYLQRNRTVQRLQLKLPMMDGYVQEGLKDLLEVNNTMREAVFRWEKDDSLVNVSPNFFTLLAQGLCNNRTLRLLELKDVHLWSPNELFDFVCCSAPPHLVIEKGTVHDDQNMYHGGPDGPLTTTGRLEGLKLVDCMFKRSLVFLLQQICHIPSLKTLEVQQHASRLDGDSMFLSEGPFHQDITDGIIPLLQYENSNNIEHLSVVGYTLDLNALCDALKFNKSLKTLIVKIREDYDEETGHCALQRQVCNVMASHNTTLERVEVFAEAWTGVIVEDPLVGYYTEMNHFGRGKARDPNTSKSQFVNLLSEAVNSATSDAILFGLLREAPGLWTSGALHDESCEHSKVTNNGKRRRLI